MKLTKKILSVFLAVVMALTCFGVAVSAYGDPETATHNIGLALKGTVGSITWSSATKFTISDPGEENAASAVNVDPGDTVFVYYYVSSDYYLENIASQIYYSADLLGPKEALVASGKGTSISKANLKKFLVWNNDNIFVETSVSGVGTIFNPWDVFVQDTIEDTGKAWPVYDCFNDNVTPTVIDKYSDGNGSYDTSKWHFYRINLLLDNENAAYAVKLEGDDATWLCKIPLQVPADAAPGTVYEVELPDESIRRAGMRRGFTCFYEIGLADGYELDENGKVPDDGEGNGAVVDEVSFANPNFTFDAAGQTPRQHVDCSQARLTITVNGGATTELDYSALEAEVATSAALNVANATDATKTPFQAALANAQAMVASQDAADQDAIDALTSALSAARLALKYKADYSALQAAITLAGTKTEAAYTRASWNAMQTALTNANAVAPDLTSEAQATINAAATALNNAITALVPVTGANYSALQVAIALAGTKVQAHYTTNSWSAMQTALTAANAVAPDLTSEDQGIIDIATNNLNTAIGALVEADANYSALTAAKAVAATKVQGDYTPASWTAFQTAYTAAQNVATGLKAKDQGIIDTAVNNLNNAINGLETLGGADYTALDAAAAATPTYPQNYYLEGAWSAYQTALTAAQNIDRGLKSNQQSIVDGIKNDLVSAFNALDNNLKDADYSAVDTAIAAYNAITNKDDYTTETINACVSAINAVVTGKKINEQATVTGYATAINAAVTGLKYKFATTAPLIAALESADAQTEALYTPASWAVLAQAVADGEALLLKNPLDIRDDADIVAAANAITAAITNLVPLGADYRELAAAKTDFEALDPAMWTSTTWAAAQTAYNAADALPDDLTIGEQKRIDDAKDALVAAMNALEEKDADYTALNAAVTAANNKKETRSMGGGVYWKNYTDATWNALQAVLATVDSVRGLKYSQQATVDAKTTELVNATTGLVWAPFDYTETNALVAQVNNADSMDYTVASYNTAKAAADAIVSGYTMENVTKGMQQLIALRNAVNALTLAGPADYSEVESAKTLAATLNESDWTAASWDVLEAALAGVVTGLNENYQTTVDGYAAAIFDAIENLVEATTPVDPVEPADYSALEAALEAAAVLTQSDWTAATWAVLAQAVAAGQAVPEGLTADDQATIDDAAQAITDAIDALEAYVAPPATGIVTGAQYAPATAGRNTFEITVQGRPSMVQFVELDHGNGTRSYDRYHDSVTITSYNAAGEQVHPLDPELAYEVWTINANLAAGRTALRAKANASRYWEDLDDAYTFEYNFKELNSGLVSAELEATEGTKVGPVATTVVVGPEAQAVQLRMVDGSTVTFVADKASGTDANGNLIFNMKSWVRAGENVITVRILDANGWKVATTLNYTVNVEAE